MLRINIKSKLNILVLAMLSMSAAASADSTDAPISVVHREISTLSTDLNSSGNFGDVRLSPTVEAALDKVFVEKVQGELDTLQSQLSATISKIDYLRSELANRVATAEVVESGISLKNKYLGISGKAKSAKVADFANSSGRANTAGNADSLQGLGASAFAKEHHRHNIADIDGLQAMLNTRSKGLSVTQVLGSEARGNWSYSYATCPAGYVLSGGGYLATTFNGGHAYNAPNGSFPDAANNRWVVSRGGMPEDRGFKAYALCVMN